MISTAFSDHPAGDRAFHPYCRESPGLTTHLNLIGYAYQNFDMRYSAGAKLGPHEILAPLGTGGMGEVYKARDTRLNRIVAIKCSSEKYTDRFRQEARTIAAVNHTNVATLYDVGDDFIVMEYVDGSPIRPTGSIRQLVGMAAQIADGLAAAHGSGIVHRDLKPDNILITKDGRVKILDFGLARQTGPLTPEDETRTNLITQAGSISGTVAYMSPEQARGRELDIRSDQFTLGIILHSLVTGKRPFDRDSPAETLAAIIRDDAPALPADVPAPFRWIVERCLAKDPADRYASTDDLYRELKMLSQHFGELSTTSASSAATPRSRSRAWLWPGTLSLVAAASAVALVLLSQTHTDLNGNIRFTPISVEPGRQRSPSFSPDSKSIAYTLDVRGVLQVFVRRLDSEGASQLTNLPADCMVYFWSADGSRIYFSHVRNLWTISATGGKPQMVLRTRWCLPALRTARR